MAFITRMFGLFEVSEILTSNSPLLSSSQPTSLFLPYVLSVANDRDSVAITTRRALVCSSVNNHQKLYVSYSENHEEAPRPLTPPCMTLAFNLLGWVTSKKENTCMYR